MYEFKKQTQFQEKLSQLKFQEDDLLELYADLYFMNSDWERSVEIIQDIKSSLEATQILGKNVTTPKVWEVLLSLESAAVKRQIYELYPYIENAKNYLEKVGKVSLVEKSIRDRYRLLGHF